MRLIILVLYPTQTIRHPMKEVMTFSSPIPGYNLVFIDIKVLKDVLVLYHLFNVDG